VEAGDEANGTLPCSSSREAEWEVRNESNAGDSNDGDDGWLDFGG